LPGERRFLSPLPRQHRPAWIDATVAAPGPHDFAVRRGRFVWQQKPPDAAASIATRATFRDDRANVPHGGAGCGRYATDLGILKSEIFFILGLDTTSETPNR